VSNVARAPQCPTPYEHFDEKKSGWSQAWADDKVPHREKSAALTETTLPRRLTIVGDTNVIAFLRPHSHALPGL